MQGNICLSDEAKIVSGGGFGGFGWYEEQGGKTRKAGVDLSDLRCSMELDELFHPPPAPLAGLVFAFCLVFSLCKGLTEIGQRYEIPSVPQCGQAPVSHPHTL